jgi:hypothetical protein
MHGIKISHQEKCRKRKKRRVSCLFFTLWQNIKFGWFLFVGILVFCREVDESALFTHMGFVWVHKGWSDCEIWSVAPLGQEMVKKTFYFAER